MKALVPKKIGTRTVISGAVLTFIGFIALMLNVFNVYGKASTSCFNNSNCNISNNLVIAYIGIVAFFAGLVVIVLGVVMLIASSRHKPLLKEKYVIGKRWVKK